MSCREGVWGTLFWFWLRGGEWWGGGEDRGGIRRGGGYPSSSSSISRAGIMPICWALGEITITSSGAGQGGFAGGQWRGVPSPGPDWRGQRVGQGVPCSDPCWGRGGVGEGGE